LDGPPDREGRPCLRAGSPGVRPQADQRRAGQREVGWAADLRARRLARASQVGAEHARQAPGLGRASPRPLRARPLAAATAPHIDADRPGEKVGVDCFFIGRLAGTKGSVWQYTAIDVASGYAWGAAL
jgi:hypothetical protein